MGNVIIPIVAFLVVNLSLLLLLARLYKRCPGNRAIVRTGVGGVQVSCGTGMIVVPSMHTWGLVSLEPVRLEMPGNMITGVDSSPEWQFTVAVGTAREQIMTAASRLLDKESNEIAELARDAITSELISSPVHSSGDVEERLRSRLSALGLELISYGPTQTGDGEIEGG